MNFERNLLSQQNKDSVEKKFDHIDNESFERAKRNINFAELLEKDELNQEDKEKLKSTLEHRKWHKIIGGLSKGDKVLTALTPTEKFLSIKNLNDNVLGPQRTDIIIAKRREFADEAFAQEISRISQKDFDPDELNLEQNYKYGLYKIPESLSQDIDVTVLSSRIAEIVDQKITEVFDEQISAVLEEARENNDNSKLETITRFKEVFHQKGFKIDVGFSEVGGDDIEDKISAMASSMRDSKINSLEKAGIIDKKIEGNEIADSVAKLQEEIISDGNSFVGDEGRELKIFEEVDGRQALNRDLLRGVRKGLIDTKGDKDAEILDKIEKYVNLINSIDFVKPFTIEEIDNFKTEANEIDEMLEKESFEDIQKLLRKNEKNENYLSNEVFDKEAVKIDNCTYLNLDVLDIGVDQLLKYEELLLKVSEGEKDFDEIAIEADDFVTNRLQEIRNNAFEIFKKHDLLTDDGLALGSLGGDELMFAVDNEKIDQEKLEELIFELKKATNTRVVKTVIAESQRQSESEDEDIRLREHLDAINRSEKGIDKIKEIEKTIRRVKSYYLEDSDASFGKKVRKLINNQVAELGLDTLVAIENSDGEIGFKNQKKEIYEYKQVIELLEQITLDAVFMASDEKNTELIDSDSEA